MDKQELEEVAKACKGIQNYREIPDIVGKKLPFGNVSARTKITSLDQLREGDHIMEESPLGYWHHFIVEEVHDDFAWRIHKTGDPQTGKHSLILGDLTSKAEVMRDKFVLEPGMVVYRVEYPKDDDAPDGVTMYSGKEVVETARKRLGERNYHAFYSNCEHFCTECKTGKCVSYQVYDLLWAIVRLIFILLHGSFWGILLIIGGSTGFVAETTIIVIAHAFAVVVGFIQDAVSVFFLVIKAEKARDKGYVTAEEAEQFKAKRVTPVVLGFVGYIAGALLGLYHVPLPLPFVGTLVGAFFGQFIWQLLGLMFGRWISTML